MFKKKLKRVCGASFLELSLALAFSLVVLAVTLQLIQEATNRINDAYRFQQYQQNISQLSQRIRELTSWNWSTQENELETLYQVLNLNALRNDNKLQISINYLSYSNNLWITGTETDHDLKEIILSHPDFNKTTRIMNTNYASIQSLFRQLHSIRIALKIYFDQNNIFPPSNQLNYLVQSGILHHIPNNPYTEESSISSPYRNITDWNYQNINSQISIHAYTHPNHIISWTY